MSGTVVSCILEDSRGTLWISTNAGISSFSRKTERFSNYTTADGLPGPDLTGTGACYKSSTGEMFFAGFSGATAFFPDKVAGTPYAPQPALTDFRELQNFIERSVILTNGRELRAPIEELTNPETHDGVVRTLNDAHRALIIKTLRQTNWVVGGSDGAAAKLGLKRTTLITKMRRLGILTGPAKRVRRAPECDWDRSPESVAAPA
jgi:hypothetical protein